MALATLVAAAAFGITLVFSHSSFFALIEWKGLDLLFALRGALPASGHIVIVAIDEPSMAEIGQQWPWPRSRHAQLIQKLRQAGARVIGFDLLFTEPSTPDEDQAFARALYDARNVVLVGVVSAINDPAFRHTTRIDPAPMFREAALTGNPSISIDGDGVVRRVREPVLGTPPFAAQVLRRFMENPAATATPQQRPLTQKALSAAGLINYRGPARTFKTVSYYQALDYERMLPPGLFTDKIVLVGWSLQGTPEPQRLTGDVFLTPFSWSAEGLFPGVEIQATIIDNLLEEQFIRELDAGPRGLALLGLALVLSAFFLWISPAAAPFAVILWCSLLLALAEWVFAMADLWLPVFSGIMMVVLTYGGHLLVRTLTAERERRQLLEATNRELESKVAERTQQLSERHRQLEATYRALVNTQAHLIHSEKMASLGMLVAGVAHEINNPLSYVHSNLEFIEDHINHLAGTLAAPDFLSDASGDHPQKIAALAATLQNVRELIASCQEGSQRVKKIVLDLRLFSRADDTGLAPTDLHASLESTLNLLARQYQDRITIHRDYGVLPLIECYPGQIHQVLMNLLQNAMQAIPDCGEVWIHTESAGDEWVRLVIRDNGVGIAQEDLNRIFDPFFTTKPIGAGTGLGLSISYGIVKKHGGNIQVRSKIAEGTALILELPVRLLGTTT